MVGKEEEGKPKSPISSEKPLRIEPVPPKVEKPIAPKGVVSEVPPPPQPGVEIPTVATKPQGIERVSTVLLMVALLLLILTLAMLLLPAMGKEVPGILRPLINIFKSL